MSSGIRSSNLPLGALIEVLGHADAGNGQRNLVRAPLDALVDAVRGIVTNDPSGVANLRAALDALTNVVNGKGSQVDVAALQQALAPLQQAVNGKANQSAVAEILARIGRINAGLYPAERPGDNPSAFTETRAGGDLDLVAPLDPAVFPVRTVVDGLGVEISGSREVWERRLHACDGVQVWRGRWRYVRTQASQDPSGDSVVAYVHWYNANREPILLPVQVDAFAPAVGAPREIVTSIGPAGADGVIVQRPAGAVYFRVGLKSFGVEGRTVVTDLGAADTTDIGNAIDRLVASGPVADLRTLIGTNAQTAAVDAGRALAEIGESQVPFVAASIGNPADAGIYSQTAPAGSTFFDGTATFSDGSLSAVFAFVRSLGSGQATLVFAMPNADGSFTAQKLLPVTVKSAGIIALKAGLDFPATSVRAGWIMGWYAPPGGAQIGFAFNGASRSCGGIPSLGQTLGLAVGFATLGFSAQYAGVGIRAVGYAAQAGAAAPTQTLWANTNSAVRFTKSRLGTLRLYIQEPGTGRGNLVFLSQTGGEWRVERVVNVAGLRAGLNELVAIRDYPPVDVGDGWALGYYAEDGGAQIAFVYNGDNSGYAMPSRPVQGQQIPFISSLVNFSINADQIGDLNPVAERVDIVEGRLGALDAGVSSLQASAAISGIQTATADRIASCSTSIAGRTVSVSGTMLRNGTLLPFAGSVTLDAPTSGTVTDEAQTLTSNGGTAWPFAPVRLANANITNLVVKDAGSGATLALGADYNAGLEHGTLVGVSAASRSVRASYTWARRRYDAVMLDPVSMTLTVVKGQERLRDAQEFVPADPVGGGSTPIRLCNVRVASSVEVIPTWSVEGGIPRSLNDQFLRDQRRSWTALTAVRSLIAAGLPVTLALQGDSIGAIQYDVPSKSTANGPQRDRATSLGGTQAYLPDALSPDAYAGLPLYDTGDGAGQTHTRMSLAWTLVRAIGKAGGGPVTYLNFGVAGESSTGGNAEPWNGAVLNSGANLLLLHFGQNELGDAGIEARIRTKLAGAYAKGMDVIVFAPPRTNAQGGVDDAAWLVTVRALRRAAEWIDPATGKSAAFVDTTYLYADVALGLGLSRQDQCGANLFNHPGIREHEGIGSLAARVTVEGLISVGRGAIQATKDGIGLGKVDNLSAAELAAAGNPVGDAIRGRLQSGGAGDVSGMSVTASGFPAPWLLADFTKYPISLERFGCKGDFNGTTGTDNATAFQKALASGEELRLPVGKKYLIGGTDPIVNRSVSIAGRGPGRGSALVFPASVGDGLRISQNSYDYSTSINNLALLTLGQETGTALSVTYSAADSANARGDVRAALDNLLISGVDFTKAGWYNGAILVDVHNLTMSNPTIVGRRDATLATRAAFGKMLAAIHFNGSSTGSIPSDALIDNPRIANAQTAILSDGYVEGLRVERPILVGVWGGVRASYTNIRPWTRVIGGHMNVFDYAVWLTNSPQSRIEQLLLYKIELTRTADPTGGRTFAVLLEACDFSNVEDLRLMNQAVSATANGDFDGIEVKSSNYCRIRCIEHERPSTGMKWSGTSQFGESDRYRSLGTYAGATIAEYVDTTGNGTNSRTDGSLPKGTASNDAAITTTLNNQFVAAINIVGCEVGQRIEFKVSATAVADNADTEIFYYAYNVGGSGDGVFGKNASTLKGRAPIPTSKEHDGVISGIYTITKRGSINMGLGVISQRTVNGVASEGPTTIPAGGIQMSATLL